MTEFSKLGLIPDPEDSRDLSISMVFEKRGVTQRPAKKVYKKEMTPVKDQGNRGTCVGFSSGAVKEWQETKEHEKEIAQGKKDHRRGRIYDFSEEWIYQHCKKIDGIPQSEGTTIRAAMKVIQKIGVPPEHAWPYMPTKQQAKLTKCASWAPMTAYWHKGGYYFRVNTLDELKTTLFEYGPVVGGAWVTDNFFNPADGIVDISSNQRKYGGHAIALTGYNDKTGLIQFKNSWGTSWGKNGYGLMTYEYYERYCIDVWCIVDESIRKILHDLPEL